MSIEKASFAEQYPVAKLQTAVQRLQQRQWQSLGTLYRTRANLTYLQTTCIYKSNKDTLQESIDLIGELIKYNLAAQRSLPSIKNKKLAEKAKAEKS